ncbi:methyltransferase-like protein 23 isoform X1 [Tanacetum coccineum]
MDDSSPEAPEKMTTTSHHHFRDSDDVISITIIESMKEEYGLFVWPCSIILAEYVWQQRLRFSGVNILELGAGTSLPGLVAAKVGANVVLTDDSHRLEAKPNQIGLVSSTKDSDQLFLVLDNMRRVCELNNVKCEVMGLTWGVWDESFFSLQPQVILGADVLYDSSAFDNLFATVKFLLENSPGSVFITSYHNRSGHHLIEFLMVKWQLKCVKLLDGFSFLPSWKASRIINDDGLSNKNVDLDNSFLKADPNTDESSVSWTQNPEVEATPILVAAEQLHHIRKRTHLSYSINKFRKKYMKSNIYHDLGKSREDINDLDEENTGSDCDSITFRS